MTNHAGRSLFVTGVTGFVGAPLVLELLRANPADRAYCLVRAADAASASQRLEKALRDAGQAYAVPAEIIASAVARSQAVCGDLTSPGLGISDDDRATLAAAAPLHVFHAAASLKDTEECLREILAHNVVGTERVLQTLMPLNLASFNHVSTAYVAGRENGVVAESLERPRGFSNRYEQSKHYGERLVIDHCERAGIPFRILRPAIVIGHSVTGAATGYTGFLGWVMKLIALTEGSGGLPRKHSLSYVARPDTRLNVIPIDSVVEDIVGIDAAGQATHNRAFHLTNSSPPTIQFLTEVIGSRLGLAPIKVVDTEQGLDPVSDKFHRWTRFERPYVAARKTFDRSSNQTYESPRHGDCELTAEIMNRMIDHTARDFARMAAAQAKGNVA